MRLSLGCNYLSSLSSFSLSFVFNPSSKVFDYESLEMKTGGEHEVRICSIMSLLIVSSDNNIQYKQQYFILLQQLFLTAVFSVSAGNYGKCRRVFGACDGLLFE